MTDNIYVYAIPLPKTINEAVMPCSDGYTIYVNERLNEHQRRKAHRHAMKHIENLDLEQRQDKSAQQIEKERHDEKRISF